LHIVPYNQLKPGLNRPEQLEFRLPDAARPKDIGLGDDSRKLALGLVALTVR